MSSQPINSIDFFKSDILNIFFLNEGWLFNVSVINPEWGTKSLFSDITTNLLVQHGYILSDGSYDISNIVHLLNQALELMKRLTNNLTQINDRIDEAENKLSELETEAKKGSELSLQIDNIRAFLLKQKGNYKEAINLLDKMKTNKHVSIASVESNKGLIFFKIGDFVSAKKSFEVVIGEKPNDLDGWFNLASSQNKLGNTKEAIKAFEKALELDPKQICINCKIGEIYETLGESEKAIEFYYKEIKVHQEECSYVIPKIISIQCELSQYKEALANLTEARRSKFIKRGSKDDLSLKITETTIFKAMDRKEEALSILNDYLEKYTFNDKFQLNHISWSYYKLGEYKKGEKYAKLSLKLDPTRPSFLDTLACSLAGLGRTKEALEAFNTALTKGGYDRVTVDVFADLMESTGETEKAKKIRNREFFQ